MCMKTESISYKDMGISDLMETTENGDTTFNFRSVCAIGQIENPNKLLKRLGEDHSEWIASKEFVDRSGTIHPTMITEPGLYYSIFNGTSKVSLDFQTWVCETLIPEARKRYIAAHTKGVTLDQMNSILSQKFAELEERVALPMTYYKAAVMSGNGGLPMRDLANAIRETLRTSSDREDRIKSNIMYTISDVSSFLVSTGFIIPKNPNYVPTEKALNDGVCGKTNGVLPVATYRAEAFPLFLDMIRDFSVDELKEIIRRGYEIKNRR